MHEPPWGTRVLVGVEIGVAVDIVAVIVGLEVCVGEGTWHSPEAGSHIPPAKNIPFTNLHASASLSMQIDVSRITCEQQPVGWQPSPSQVPVVMTLTHVSAGQSVGGRDAQSSTHSPPPQASGLSPVQRQQNCGSHWPVSGRHFSPGWNSPWASTHASASLATQSLDPSSLTASAQQPVG
jgi:hypothetical protein